mgnify:CR=1 FL=1
MNNKIFKEFDLMKVILLPFSYLRTSCVGKERNIAEHFHFLALGMDLGCLVHVFVHGVAFRSPLRPWGVSRENPKLIGFVA